MIFYIENVKNTCSSIIIITYVVLINIHAQLYGVGVDQKGCVS